MKQGSDNSRESSIFNVIEELISRNIMIKVYDPSIKTSEINGIKLITDFAKFVELSDLIIANRLEDDIKPFSDKVFSRDIFSSDE
jgi:UDPglucose 6-dehydrogenase